jgi:hypothetical protein
MYRILKQFIPAPLNESDPLWAKRQVWVLKLNSEDTIDEFPTQEEAQAYADILAADDPTNRVYKVKRI